MQLRDYQKQVVDRTNQAWAQGARNVLDVLPCGGGKTVVFGTIIQNNEGGSCAIAHRQELVGQMSVTLARLGVHHRIIAPPSTIGEIVTLQMREVGRSYHDTNAAAAVASVQTLARRGAEIGSWAQRATLWVTDECHHLQGEGVWSQAIALFPQARGLGVTATPERADGKGLGRHADGVMDVMIEGPPPRDLIDMGYLTDYRIFGPESDLDVSNVPISDATGDYSQPALRAATKRSRVTGDIVSNYLRLAPGKLGVTFAVSVELAEETAAQFRTAGVPAECLSAKTPALIRSSVLHRFAKREVLQLVNVDLFGEGFDLPAMEVISMGRRTASFPLFYQMFWRPCRPSPGKDRALIIDHVGNVLYHAMRGGMPDAARVWSLDRRERRGRAAVGPPTVRACLECTGIYERWRSCCPYCGWVPVPQSRVAPEFVDGDLTELDPAALAALSRSTRREFHVPYGAGPEIVGRKRREHFEHQQTQVALREQIAWWGGWQRALGRDDPEAYRRFYLEFGTDVLTAQTGDRAAMQGLTERIERVLERNGVVRVNEEIAA